MNVNTLAIIGSGIKFLSHITYEAKNCIEKADKVLYLVNEPATQEWIQTLNQNSESLDHLYNKHSARNNNYLSISEYIIDQLEKIKLLCVVFYGHPTVLVQPSIYTAQSAKERGHNVIAFPGISAEDCLFADLLIDPSSCGCQSFEATDFILYQRNYDSSCHLILWQPCVIGVKRIVANHNPKEGLKLLTDYLSKRYSPHHTVILYEAAQYPTFISRIEKVQLQNLSDANVNRLTTLYIPPNYVRQKDKILLHKLELINKSLQQQ